MKKILVALIIVLMGTVSYGADDDVYFTAGMKNGRLWNEMNNDVKLIYVNGIRSGALAMKIYYDTLVEKTKSSEVVDDVVTFLAIQMLLKPLNHQEKVDVLNKFYDAEININIPIPEAYAYIATRATASNEQDSKWDERAALRVLRARHNR